MRDARPAAAPAVDVYLFPAVVGGGRGDVEEVLAAGRRLARAGFRPTVFRAPGRSPPPGIDARWRGIPFRRSRRLILRGSAALTVAPAWGVSAAPPRPGPLGRPGPWAVEAAAIERAYGVDRTLHVSLEEFARTLTSGAENLERLREGGVPRRALAARLRRARSRGEIDAFDRAFARFRAFDRPNVLHVFATFERSRAFAREYPRAVQTGPLWSGKYRRARRGRRTRSGGWIWYASPASAETIAPEVVRALAAGRAPIHLYVRTPRPWRTEFDPARVTIASTPIDERTWRRRFAAADLRIVTGSRTLIEAMELGGPFLYFNGVLGSGPGRRRHRPEKIAALLALGRRHRWPADVLRDLADFARARRIPGVVARAARREGGWARFPTAVRRPTFPRPYGDAGTLVVAAAKALAVPGARAPETVERFRRGSNP